MTDRKLFDDAYRLLGRLDELVQFNNMLKTAVEELETAGCNDAITVINTLKLKISEKLNDCCTQLKDIQIEVDKDCRIYNERVELYEQYSRELTEIPIKMIQDLKDFCDKEDERENVIQNKLELLAKSIGDDEYRKRVWVNIKELNPKEMFKFEECVAVWLEIIDNNRLPEEFKSISDDIFIACHNSFINKRMGMDPFTICQTTLDKLPIWFTTTYISNSILDNELPEDFPDRLAKAT